MESICTPDLPALTVRPVGELTRSAGPSQKTDKQLSIKIRAIPQNAYAFYVGLTQFGGRDFHEIGAGRVIPQQLDTAGTEET
jgi:hypothetical protein